MVVRRYIDFFILLIPIPLVSVLFCSSIPTFSFFECFSFLFQYFLLFNFLYSIIISRSINTHTGNYGRPTAAISRAAHNVFYTKKHTQTNVSYAVMDISCMPSSRSRCRGRALYRDASRAVNVLGLSPSRGGDLEPEGGVNVSL